eukprot:14044131-Alexandrium_andersonii.AAC.1
MSAQRSGTSRLLTLSAPNSQTTFPIARARHASYISSHTSSMAPNGGAFRPLGSGTADPRSRSPPPGV